MPQGKAKKKIKLEGQKFLRRGDARILRIVVKAKDKKNDKDKK